MPVSAIGFNDLSPELQKEVQQLQKRMSVELEPLILESTLTMQKILEAKDHKERVVLLLFFVDAERKRLEARKVLQGMFTGETVIDEEVGDIAALNVESDAVSDVDEGSNSIFMDEPDAFQ